MKKKTRVEIKKRTFELPFRVVEAELTSCARLRKQLEEAVDNNSYEPSLFEV